MVSLPTGTVTLLFSDIEGSTALLSRLGPAYADALDVQRRVLRTAWAAHGGTELGTEGDSFFVGFPTAPDAVNAATQAQRELSAYPWPGGERVRVRMGIHTGTPKVHDGGYVGMDVHRAARIAGAAHGGQVVISQATAVLMEGGLPAGVALGELGSHQLKDLSQAERLYQLKIDGLQTDFPPLKSLGSASSLPRPATPLVGRDGELAELTALLSLPDVRLVTLTGPGGSGKTRLAIGVAQQLVPAIPDGVYFAPLAAVTTQDSMWTSIAETLDVPPEGRTPPALFAHLAYRRALLVLDNLEQLPGADQVVAELLNVAPHVALIATSRRPLHVAGEHEHPVPPLELPDGTDMAEASGAVQMFVQHARMVRPGFAVSVENVADVAAVCRRLDGLPLAIELAAARSKLLSPRALLARLDTALDIAATDRSVPSRQKTLRATIAWSYELLDADRQAFFRRLSVFAGGADLDAIAAVTGDPGHDGGPLDVVAALVDASLATIAERDGGEPRVGMLETVKAFALDQLTANGEADEVGTCHAAHYLHVAERLRSMSEGDFVEAHSQAETELDNFREALGWTLQQRAGGIIDQHRVTLGLRLASTLGWLWSIGGYLSEGRGWYERAIECSDGSPSPGLAGCFLDLACVLDLQGEARLARDLAMRSVAMARGLDDEQQVAQALAMLARAQADSGDCEAARKSLEEALDLARHRGDRIAQAGLLGNLAVVADIQLDFDRAETLYHESLTIARDTGNTYQQAVNEMNLAGLLARTGRVQEAHRLAQGLVAKVLELRDPRLTIDFAGISVDILVRLGDAHRAARLLGAAEAMREQNGMPILQHDEDDYQDIVTSGQALIGTVEWDRQIQLGRGETLEDLLHQLGSPRNTQSLPSC